MISAAEYQTQSSHWDSSYSKWKILKGYSPDGLTVRTMLLDRKVLHYLLFSPFSWRATYTKLPSRSFHKLQFMSGKSCVKREEGKQIERQEKLQLLGALLTQHEPQNTLRATGMEAANLQTRSQMTCQRVTERHDTYPAQTAWGTTLVFKKKNQFKSQRLRFLKGDWSPAIDNAIIFVYICYKHFKMNPKKP